MRTPDVAGDRWRRSMRFLRVLGESLAWKDDRMAKEQQTDERGDKHDSDVLLKQTSAGKGIGDEVRKRDADYWGKA